MVKKKQILCMAAILALLSGVTDISKVRASAPGQFERLELEKAYKLDLDYDGKYEKIIFEQTDVEDDENMKTLTVYINDNNVYSKTVECLGFNVQLADINVDDNVQDICVSTSGYSDCCMGTFFLQYRDSKLKLIKTIKEKDASKYLSLYRYSFGHISDAASFPLIADTPINIQPIGSYLCLIPYQLTNRRLAAVKTNTYDLSSESKKYVYKAKKKFVTYKSYNSGATVAFTVKPGDKVKVDKIYVSDKGKSYVRIINSKNVKGWIDGSQANLFVKTPGWG